jgi:hypothetical protein
MLPNTTNSIFFAFKITKAKTFFYSINLKNALEIKNLQKFLTQAIIKFMTTFHYQSVLQKLTLKITHFIEIYSTINI